MIVLELSGTALSGRGVNPLGDEALAMLDDWWEPTSCAAIHAAEDGGTGGVDG